MNDKEWLRMTINAMPMVKLAVCRDMDWSIFFPGMQMCPVCYAFALWINGNEAMG